MSSSSCSTKWVGVGLLAGSVLCALPSDTNSAFEASLTTEQKRIWKQVHIERLKIYVCSLLASLVLVNYVLPFPDDKWLKVMLVLLLTGSVYMLWPKSTYMVYHINTEQAKLLKKTGRNQMIKYHGAVALSILSIPLLCR